ncbi:MAG: hypothetical protein ACR2PT_02970 [Endozoicomonas sp.]
MRPCSDCTEDIKRTNRIWTTTCIVITLFGLSAGFVLGQMSVVGY